MDINFDLFYYNIKNELETLSSHSYFSCCFHFSGTFTYSIDQSSLSTDTFGIKSNGDLYLKSSLTSYGYGKSLKFTALATDTGTLQGSATVFVVIPQTTTTTTTTTDRMVTFIEYPPNVAWLIVAIILGLVILSMPVIILFKTNGPCTWKGRFV